MDIETLIYVLIGIYASYATFKWKETEKASHALLKIMLHNNVDPLSKENIEIAAKFFSEK